MKKLLLSLALLLLLTRCGVLEHARYYNQSYAAARTLKEIEATLQTAEPTGNKVTTLFLYDESGTKQAELTALIPHLTDREDKILAAFLTGDLMTLERTMGFPKTQQDTLLLANMHLMQGNWREAERLRTDDLCTHAAIALTKEQPEKARILLTKILEKGRGVPRERRLRAGRALLQITPSPISPNLYRTVAQLTTHPWERFMLQALAGERNWETAREEAFVTYLDALSDSSQLQKATQLVLAQSGSPWRTQALHRLRPLLVEAAHFPEALEVHDALPQHLQPSYPFTLLPEYRAEIELLKRYERAETYVEKNVPREKSHRTGTFRELWGNVPNVDNWVMEYGRGFSEPTTSPATLPTEEEYNQLKMHLRSLIKL